MIVWFMDTEYNGEGEKERGEDNRYYHVNEHDENSKKKGELVDLYEHEIEQSIANFNVEEFRGWKKIRESLD
ncbi:hypothetical protein Bca101_077040 [Brassica carinata]